MLEQILERSDLGELRPMIARINELIEAEHSRLTMIVKADWRVNVEIALEDLHVPFVHPETFHKLGLKCVEMEQYGKHSLAYYKVTDARTIKALRSVERYFDSVDPRHYFHVFLYPNICISSVGGFTYSLQVYGGYSGSDAVFHHILYRPHARADLREFFDKAAEFNRVVFIEDKVACERIHRYDPTGPLCEAERRVKWFREAQQ